MNKTYHIVNVLGIPLSCGTAPTHQEAEELARRFEEQDGEPYRVVCEEQEESREEQP